MQELQAYGSQFASADETGYTFAGGSQIKTPTDYYFRSQNDAFTTDKGSTSFAYPKSSVQPIHDPEHARKLRLRALKFRTDKSLRVTRREAQQKILKGLNLATRN